MIVDDEPIILQGLRSLIDWESLDIEIVAEASCGSDALDILLTQKVHILITDIKMSYMNGLELIKQIRERKLTTKIIVLSGYDDFTYIKEAVNYGIENYLLKPVSDTELLSTLQLTIEQLEMNLYQFDILKNNFLTKWVNKRIDEDEFIDKAEFLDINLDCTNYAALVFKPVESHGLSEAHIQMPPTDRTDSLANIILKRQNTSWNPLLFQDFDGNFVLIVSDFTQQQYHSLCDKILHSIIRNSRSSLNTQLFVTVGSIENSPYDLYKSYTSAIELQRYKLVMPSEDIITYNDISLKNASNQQLLHLDFLEYKNFIIRMDNDKINLWIDEIFTQIHKHHHMKPMNIHNLVLEILFFTISTIKSLDNTANIASVQTSSYTDALNQKSLDEIKTWLKDSIAQFIDILENNVNKNLTLIDTITIYIQDNYSKNINLRTIATEFHKNPAYVGQLFKKEVGESFTTYINKIRVEKARHLLTQNPSLTIDEIACQVGYYNPNYFLTIFKKLTDMTPSQYKQLV